jgi:hypothetical protein
MVNNRGYGQDDPGSIVTSAVARFDYGDQTYSVFPMASNVRFPAQQQQWQFRYLPLMHPEIDQKTKVLRIDNREVGDGWVVSVTLWFDNRLARAAAFNAIKVAFPDDASKLQETNVGSMAVSQVTFIVDHPRGKLRTEPFNPGANPSYVLSIPAKTKADAEIIEAWLLSPQAKIRCEYTYGTRKLTENSRVVTMKHLRDTELRRTLDGLPKDVKGMVYVHRDAFQKLVEKVKSQMGIIDWVEDPATFDASIVDGLLLHWNKQLELDLTKWGELKLASVYNPDDLSPDRITRDFRKSFDYDQGKGYTVVAVDGSFTGNFSLGVMSMGSKGTVNYNKEELTEHLRKHGLEVELDGMMIKPKKIWLQEVNTADFSTEATIANRRLFVGEKGSEIITQDLTPSRNVQGGAVQKDVLSRVAELELAQVKAEKGKPVVHLNTTAREKFRPFDVGEVNVAKTVPDTEINVDFQGPTAVVLLFKHGRLGGPGNEMFVFEIWSDDKPVSTGILMLTDVDNMLWAGELSGGKHTFKVTVKSIPRPPGAGQFTSWTFRPFPGHGKLLSPSLFMVLGVPHQ